ncbi:MAG: ATP-binding protein [Candidatus Rokubacteria bacterium]|nr:ATP-binding protein [Candidatus Rokubacteria bacterium]
MPLPLMMTFISTMAFAIQFLIFVYLYHSHRVRFFHYLLWAWGFFTVSKGAKLVGSVLADGHPMTPVCMDVAGMAAPLCLLAAALAYRWDYRVRRSHIAGALAVALAVAVLKNWDASDVLAIPLGLLLGATQIAAALVFWPSRSTAQAYRGGRLLAASLGLWGLHRIGMVFVHAEPGTSTYLAAHGMFMVFYFMTTFAVIIMVLDRARSEVRSLKELNERLVDGLGEGLVLVGGDFAVRHANRWMVEQFGPVVGRRCHEVLTADGRQCPGCPLARREAMEGPVRLEVGGVDGRRFLLSCAPVRQPDGEVLLLELVADVTEQARLHARLRKAERLAAAGELAAGMAHEIRNPLAAIVNATTLLGAEEILTREERASTLAAVKTEARRLNRILSDFLVFARPLEPRFLLADVRDVVEHVTSLIRDDRGRARGVELRVDVDPTVPAFPFDRDQMTQVVWNIALNGIEAMDGRGRLSLEVLRQDGHVALAISDTGRGIPAAEQRRVFEPFYSRKGGGSGLGLTIADRIVAAHGGRIEVQSVPGRGTRITLLFPTSAAAAVEAPLRDVVGA